MLQLDLERNRLQERLWKFALGLDIAFNGLFGGKSRETISGSVGRARYQAHKWWAPAAVSIVDSLFGKGHCWTEMVKEETRRALEGR